MATDASMDQPSPPPADANNLNDALRLIDERLGEIEHEIMRVASPSGARFYYCSKHDADTPVEITLTPLDGLRIRHRGVGEWSSIQGDSTQLRLLLARESPRLCAMASLFYADLADLAKRGAQTHLRVMDAAVQMLTRPPLHDARGEHKGIPGMVLPGE